MHFKQILIQQQYPSMWRISTFLVSIASLLINPVQLLFPQNIQSYASFLSESDVLQEGIIHNQEVSSNKKEQQDKLSSLPSYVADEFRLFAEYKDIFEYEGLSVYLEQQYELKWMIPKPGEYSFRVNVYDLDGKDVVLRKNPAEQECVLVLVSSSNPRSEMNVQKVYLSKIIKISSTEPSQEYKLVFRPNNPDDRKILIDIDLQKLDISISQGINDDKFRLSAQKMKVVLRELEQTENRHGKLFLEEYTVLGREERNQSEMLVLTSIELLVILGTAIIQIYCMKNLIDNRIII